MSEAINCIIIDDEPIARDIIKAYCSHLPALNIIASCGNALEAKGIIQKQQTDLLFLDNNMPVLDGIAFLKTLKNAPQIIFTTAYKEFALDAFDLAACDYLLKPFSLERFIVSVDKALERLQPRQEIKKQNDTPVNDFIFIKADGKIFKVPFADLLYAEAKGNYIKVVTTQQPLMQAMTFTVFQEQLPALFFVRVHRSFIINKSKITHVEGNCVFINQTEIPIGNNYKDAFLKELGF